jgi:hypothetical protein
MRGEAIATSINAAHTTGAPKLPGASIRGDKVSKQECSEEHGRTPTVAAGRQAGEKAALAASGRGEAAALTTGGHGITVGPSGQRVGAGPRRTCTATGSTGGEKVRARGLPVIRKASDSTVKEKYGECHWPKKFMTFNLAPASFSGPKPGLRRQWEKVPTFMQLFRTFWPNEVMQRVCDETNRYATEEWKLEYEDGRNELWTKGVKKWTDLTMKEFQAFLVWNLIMALKKMPNLRNY